MEKNGAITPSTPDPEKLSAAAKSEQEKLQLLDTDLVKQAAAAVTAKKTTSKE